AKRSRVAETPEAKQRRSGSLAHRLQELAVARRAVELVAEEFHRFHGVELGQELAQDPNAVQRRRRDEELLLACARARDVERREDALVHQPAVEMDLHVPGALELLEDDLVHTAARVDERRADDREAAAVLDVAGRAEELLRAAERVRVD